MLSHALLKRHKPRVSPTSRRKWSIVFAGTAVVLALLAALCTMTPLQAKLKAFGEHPTMKGQYRAGDTPEESLFTQEEECVVRTLVIGATEKPQSYVYSGEVRGRYESVLAFQAGGRIVKREVQLGDVVRAGDVLMEIDPKDIKESVALARAQVRAAESQLRLAELNLGRFKRLDSEGVIPRLKLDQSQSEYDAASSAYEQASAMLSVSSNQLGYTVLRADTDGVIAGISAEVGQVVAPGIPVLTLVRDGDQEVEITIPEIRVGSLQDVSSITVSFWALRGVELAGEIREVAPMADPILRTYKVRIRLVDAPPEIKLGMTASVRMEEGHGAAPVRLVPLSAIYQEEDTPHVWVIQDRKLELRPVELDGFDHDGVRVVSGLEDGDVVVTAGVHKLVAGQKVRTSTETQS